MAYRAVAIDQVLADEPPESDLAGVVSRFLSKIRETAPYSLATLFRRTRSAVFERLGTVDRPLTRDNYLAVTNTTRDSHPTIDRVFSNWE
jgi:hypothetical protein